MEESVSHYRLLERIGSGGMGEVYKARDTRLDRLAAVKILLPGVSDESRKLRFIAEAKAASALNHPNIVTIYDAGSDEATAFIAMEYVPGRTLADAISGKPMPLASAVDYAIQIADALAAAHKAGIIHRDLKPGNVMITGEGTVKLLDFGLAKLLEPARVAAEETRTIHVAPLTEAGVILGTAAYMSPEQAAGHEVDARSDIFSFGVVLYEMLTGRRPFEGRTAMETAAAILKDNFVPPAEFVAALPGELDRIVRHCLAKNPGVRFQSIADVARLLEDVRDGLSSPRRGSAVQPAPTRRRAYAVAAMVLLALATAAAAWYRTRVRPAVPGSMLTRMTFDSGLTTDPALSGDGKLLAYASDRAGAGNLDIWVRQVAGGEPLQITHDPADESQPHFSPDGARIAFRSERDGGGIYLTSSLGGGEPQLIAPDGRAPRFSPDGKWIAYQVGEAGAPRGRPMRSKVFVLNLSGGQTRELAPALPAAYRPVWSPDSKFVLFSGSSVADVALPPDWYVAPVEGGSAQMVRGFDRVRAHGLDEMVPDVWTASGDVVFSAKFGDATQIWKVPVRGNPWGVPDRASQITFGTGTQCNASMASAAESRVVFSVLASTVGLWTLKVNPASGVAAAQPSRLTADEATEAFPDVDGGGTELTFTSNRSGNDDIYIKDLRTGADHAVVASPLRETASIIAPDASKVAYFMRQGNGSIAIALLGPGAAAMTRKKVCDPCGIPYGWAADERWLVHAAKSEHWDLAATDVVGGAHYVVARRPDADTLHARLSPDKRWIVATAVKEGRRRLYVAPFHLGTTIGAAEWFPLTDGATWEDNAQWSRDGAFVYYTSDRDGFRCIWAQRFDARAGKPSGAAFAVYHSHAARLSIKNTGSEHLGIAVAPDKLVFGLGEVRGNIWMGAVPDK